MVDVFRDSYKSMLLGVEVSLVATFGGSVTGSALTDVWVLVMVVGLLITFVGVIQPAPGE